MPRGTHLAPVTLGDFPAPKTAARFRGYENLLQAALAGALGSGAKPAAGLGSWANAPGPAQQDNLQKKRTIPRRIRRNIGWQRVGCGATCAPVLRDARRRALLGGEPCPSCGRSPCSSASNSSALRRAPSRSGETLPSCRDSPCGGPSRKRSEHAQRGNILRLPFQPPTSQPARRRKAEASGR